MSDDSEDLSFALRSDGESVPLRSVESLRGNRKDAQKNLGNVGSSRLGFVLFADVEATLQPSARLVLRVGAGVRSVDLPFLLHDEASAREFQRSISGYKQAEKDAAQQLALSRLGTVGMGDDWIAGPETWRSFVRAWVDSAHLVGTRGVFLSGWVLDPDGNLSQAHLLTKAGKSPDLLATAARCSRGDLAQVVPGHADSLANAGLVAYVQMDVDDAIDSGELLLTARSGQLAKITFAIEEPSGSIRAKTEAFLRHLDLGSLATVDLLDRHVGPALQALWAQRSRARPREKVHDFGPQPEHPVCSVIIPLFGRSDLLMHQLSQLCQDPDLAQTEIIYVVDDPRIADETLCLAAEVAHLFPLPFRVIDARTNLGYAGANNLGAGIARGHYLLLLNSDVFPNRRGWLGRLCDKHSALPDAGAIAPRLLYEDGSVQHDGMRFAPHPKFPSLWINEHPGKGLPLRLAPPAEDVQVPAVTAACMLLPRRMFSEVGGLDEEFIVGDFEDSDLCLKLRERGLQSYVIRSETLFHLERLSQNLIHDLAWRHKVTLYNCWRQARRWGSVLSEE